MLYTHKGKKLKRKLRTENRVIDNNWKEKSRVSMETMSRKFLTTCWFSSNEVNRIKAIEKTYYLNIKNYLLSSPRARIRFTTNAFEKQDTLL